MDTEEHDNRRPRNQDPSGSRRKFLRQIGLTAATAAAVAGFTDLAGVRPASAATKGAASRNLPPAAGKQVQEIRPRGDVAYTGRFCIVSKGKCGRPCTPAGTYCHRCCYTTSCVWATAHSCFLWCHGGDFDFCSAV